jgi:hypothetical protein
MSFQQVKDGKVFQIGNIFCLYSKRDLFWFRFFNGYGLHGKNVKTRGLLFSERNNLSKRWKVGNWIFKFLKP